MPDITLDQAKTVIAAALEKGREMGLKPLSAVVVDAGGHTKAFEREDGASTGRYQIAFGKAHGSIALGMGSRALFERSERQPYFLDAVNVMLNGGVMPVPGGALIRDGDGAVIGAIGVTGDVSDNDEVCAVAGVEAAGLTPDTGG